MTHPNNSLPEFEDDEEEIDVDYETDIANEKLADCEAVLADTVEQLQTIRELVIEMLTDLVRNGFVDEYKGEIESRCDPVVLRQLADYVGVEL